MSQNFLNLALRFLLELSALFAMGYWGWSAAQGIFRFVLAAGIPLLAAFLWGSVRQPEDAPQQKHVLFPVHGSVRLLLEFLFFGFAVWGLYKANAPRQANILAAVVLFHYVISYDRVGRLLRR